MNAYTFGTINLATGAYTVINNQGGGLDWHGLAANPAASLFYSVDIDAENYPLVSVTPAGTIAVIGPTSQDIRGLAYLGTTAIPEPGTFSLLLAGGALLALARRRRAA